MRRGGGAKGGGGGSGGSKRNNKKPVHTAEGRVVPCLEVVLVEGAGRLDLVCMQP